MGREFCVRPHPSKANRAEIAKSKMDSPPPIDCCLIRWDPMQSFYVKFMIESRLRTQIYSPSLRFLLPKPLRATVPARVGSFQHQPTAANTSGDEKETSSMVFLLLWKGVGVCKSWFGSSNRLGDRSINKPKRTHGQTDGSVIHLCKFVQ